jgi:hypothetical protein
LTTHPQPLGTEDARARPCAGATIGIPPRFAAAVTPLLLDGRLHALVAAAALLAGLLLGPGEADAGWRGMP